jgi:hypothetical protein
MFAFFRFAFTARSKISPAKGTAPTPVSMRMFETIFASLVEGRPSLRACITIKPEAIAANPSPTTGRKSPISPSTPIRRFSPGTLTAESSRRASVSICFRCAFVRASASMRRRLYWTSPVGGSRIALQLPYRDRKWCKEASAQLRVWPQRFVEGFTRPTTRPFGVVARMGDLST